MNPPNPKTFPQKTNDKPAQYKNEKSEQLLKGKIVW